MKWISRSACIIGLTLFCGGIRAEIVKYPFLQPTADMETSIGIMWETEHQNGGKVFYGLDKPDQAADAGYGGVSTLGYHRYQVRIGKLQPGRTYKYRVISDGTETPEHTLTLSSTADDFRFKVLLLSDTHIETSVPDQQGSRTYKKRLDTLLQAAMEFKPHLVIHCGDVGNCQVPPRDTAKLLDAQYLATHKIFKDLFAQAVFAPSAGNHDTCKDREGRGHSIFTDNYFLPENGPEAEGEGFDFVREAVYAFNYGGVFFQGYGVGYQGVDLKGDKKTTFRFRDLHGWIENGMKEAIAGGKARNTILFGHLVNGRHIVNEKFAKRMDPYHPALMFMGHDHNWHRMQPMSVEGGVVRYFKGGKDRYEGHVGLIFCRVPSTSYAKNTTRIEPNPNEACFVEKVGFATLEIGGGGREISGKAYAIEDNERVMEVDAFKVVRDIRVPDGRK